MKFLTDPNNRYYKLFDTLADYMLLTFLFVITSLPVLTLGPSLIALYSVSFAAEKDHEISLYKSYLHQFKTNFLRGVALTTVLIVVLFLWGFSILSIPALKGNSYYFGIFGVTLFSVVIWITTVYVFPYTARFQDNFTTTLKNSFLIGMLNWKETLKITLTFAAGIFLFLSNSFFFTIFLLVFFTFGIYGIVLLIAKKMLPIFSKYEKVS